MVSSMICARIAYLGMAEHSNRIASGKEVMKYAGTIPIIVESALPYAVAGIAFAVSYGMENGTSIFFLSIYVMFTVSLVLVSSLWVVFSRVSLCLTDNWLNVQCISPQMIIMRVADGTAWQRYGVDATSVIGPRPMSSGGGVPNIGSGVDTDSELQP
jgi:hypothetical protein